MITLCGFPVSNYYNKIKLVLLEKEVPFREEWVRPSQDEALLRRSPLGKIPFIETEWGCLSESQVILDYLEEAYPEKPLYPAHPFERAKCRELIQHLEVNIELQVRRLYKEVLFGDTVSGETKDEVREKVTAALQGFARLVKFGPYIGGDVFTAADCVAWIHFRVIGLATRKIYAEDWLAEPLPKVAEYMKLMETRPHVRRVAAEQATALETLLNRK